MSKPVSPVPLDAWVIDKNSPTITVELFPGATREVRVPTKVPTFGLSQLHQDPKTRVVKALPVMWHSLARMNNQLPEQLGIPVSRHTFYQLIQAGFIIGYQFSEREILVDLFSLIWHLKRCRIHPDVQPFWTVDRRKKLRNTAYRIKGLNEPDLEFEASFDPLQFDWHERQNMIQTEFDFAA